MNNEPTVAQEIASALKRHGVEILFAQSLPSMVALSAEDLKIRQFTYRTENAGASYATIRAQFYSQLQSVYGQPGSDTALDTVFNNFTSSLQALQGSPDDPSAQSSVVTTAQLLAQPDIDGGLVGGASLKAPDFLQIIAAAR